MEEVSREAKIGQRLYDEREEGHVVGLGRNTELTRFGDRTASDHVMLEFTPQHNSGSRTSMACRSIISHNPTLYLTSPL